MKHLLTRLLLMMMVVLSVPIANATDFYLLGAANAIGSGGQANWDPSQPVTLTTDGNGDVYFWADGNFKISSSKGSNNGDWSGFNSNALRIWYDNGTLKWERDNGADDSKVGDGTKYVKLHYNGNGLTTNSNYTVTVQDTQFITNPGIFGLNGGWNESDIDYSNWTKTSDTKYVYAYTPYNDGKKYFRIKYGTSGKTYYAPQNDNSPTEVENGKSYPTWDKDKIGDGNSFCINAKKDVTYNIEFDTANKQVKVTWTDTPVNKNLWIGGNNVTINGQKLTNSWGQTIKVNDGEGFISITIPNNSTDDQWFSFYNEANTQLSVNNNGIYTDGRKMTTTANSNACKVTANSGDLSIVIDSYDGNEGVTFHAVKTGHAPATSLYLRGTNSAGQNITTAMRKSGNTFVLSELNYTAGTQLKFNFSQNNGNWNAWNLYPSADNTVANLGQNSGQNYEYNTTGAAQNNKWVFTSESSDPITITVDLSNPEAPTFTITQAPRTNKYYLAGGFQDNWTKTKRQLFEPTADPKVLTVTALYHEGNDGNSGFKITTKESTDDGTWYSIGGATRMGNYNANSSYVYDIANKTLESNMLLDQTAYMQTVTFTLTLGDDGKPSKLSASWDTEANIVLGDYMNAYPEGVYTDDDFKRYSKWPVIYLKSRVLNDEAETPEYQMKKVSDNEYTLELTMRNTYSKDKTNGDAERNVFLTIYNNANSAGVNAATTQVNLTDSKYGKKSGNESEGMRMKATAKRDASGNWSLTFERIGDASEIPFISLVGANWKQRIDKNIETFTWNDGKNVAYATPDHNQWGGKWKNTDQGWQEAWIQYDNRGKILLDRKGKVMYNTMWPPKNPILFKTEFKLNENDTDTKDFTLTSKDLTMSLYKTTDGKTQMTGKQWKEYFLFKDYKNTDLGGGNQVFKKLLALKDTETYSLYRVEDIWINGAVKFWTGWGGVHHETGELVAIWETHSNWGHFGKDSYDNEGWNGNGHAFGIWPESSVPLGIEHGDVEFEKPTFFKAFDLFIDVNAPHTANRNVLFTELAHGGAQIAALSTSNGTETSQNDYEVGNFQASLSNLSGMAEGKVKKVVIRSYATTQNGDDESVEVVNSNVFTWEAGNVTNQDFYTIFNSRQTSPGLTAEGSKVKDISSTSKWVKDEYEYSSGDYFYRMFITLTSNDGTEYQETVDSNPFSIVVPEKITVNSYQLVKIEDRTVGGVQTGIYYTYKGNVNNPSVPEYPVYKVTIENDDKFDGESWGWQYDNDDNASYDENGNMTGGYVDDTNYVFKYENIEDMPDYTSNDYQFTDKILLVGSVPSATSVKGYQFNADNADPAQTPASKPAKVAGPMKEQGSAITEEWDRSTMQPEYGNRFMHVTNVGNFNKRIFNLQMQYSNVVFDEESKKYITVTDTLANSAEVVYTPVIPEPSLRGAEVQVFYGSNTNSNTDDAVKNFEFRGLTLENARYHSVRDRIEVDYPNVSRYLKERMRIRDFFSITLSGGGIVGVDTVTGNETQKWSNVFAFGTEYAPNATDSIGVVRGPLMHPKDFNNKRTVALEKTPGYQYINRGWKNQVIAPIYLTDNAPIQMDHKIGRAELKYDEEGNLISEVDIYIRHKGDYVPSNPASNPSEEFNNHNYIYHLGKDANGNLISDPDNIPTDENNNPIITDTNKDRFKHEHLRHHSDKDYYYIAIYSESERLKDIASDDETKADNGDYSDDIIDEDCNVVGLNNNPETGKAPLHFVVPAADLLGTEIGNVNQGYKITVRKNYGKYGPDGQTWSYWGLESHRKAIEKIVGEDHFVHDLRVSVSYLYPFEVEETVTAAPSNRPMRVVSDYETSNVLKSQADESALELRAEDVWTSLDGIYDDMSGLTVGDGYIEVEGNNVMIFTMDGATVAQGEGRHYVGNGVYVVRYNGRTAKVIVK